MYAGLFALSITLPRPRFRLSTYHLALSFPYKAHTLHSPSPSVQPDRHTLSTYPFSEYPAPSRSYHRYTYKSAAASWHEAVCAVHLHWRSQTPRFHHSPVHDPSVPKFRHEKHPWYHTRLLPDDAEYTPWQIVHTLSHMFHQPLTVHPLPQKNLLLHQHRSRYF